MADTDLLDAPLAEDEETLAPPVRPIRAIAPPVAPDIAPVPAAPPAMPPVAHGAGPNFGTAMDNTIGARPNPNAPQYQPIKPSLGKDILGRIAAGMAAYKNPQVGLAIRNRQVNEPLEEARNKYNTDLNAYNQNFSQELQLSNEQQNEPLRASEIAKNNAAANAVGDKLDVQKEYSHALAVGDIATADRLEPMVKRYLQATQKPSSQEGELPLGDSAANLNQALQDRYQVLHPGKTLPPEYTINPKSTQKDYDRIEKSLSGEEAATGTAAQRSAANTAREQAGGARETARSDKSYQYNQSALDKLRTPVEQRLEKIATATTNLDLKSPQADSLLAPEILSVMAGGQGSGLRMNEAEISRIVGGATKWTQLQTKLNAWRLDPQHVTFDPAQRKQMADILNAAKVKAQKKIEILDKANDSLLDTDDVKQHRSITSKAKKDLDSVDAGQGGRESQTAGNKTWNPKTGRYE